MKIENTVKFINLGIKSDILAFNDNKVQKYLTRL